MRKFKIYMMSAMLIALMILFVACGKDEDNDAPAVTNTPVASTEAPTKEPDATPTAVPSATAAPAVTENEQPTATPLVTDSDQPTPTPAEDASPTEIPPTPTPTLRDTTAERDEYWELTYLIWIPKFTDGSFSGKDSDDTFDYAEFEDVNPKNVAAYIETLKSAGFTNIKTGNISGDTAEFAATNDDDWSVRLFFKDGKLVIGSGFVDPEAPSSEEEARANAWASTDLQYLPEFKGGSFVSTSQEIDDMVFTYAFFDEVTEDDVRKYVQSLKDAGYIYGPDEGDMDGIIWYMAINEDRLNCYVAYDNNLVKIGCGYEE